MTTRILILGAGFGGLELSSTLATTLPGEVEVTLIDQSDSFAFGFTKLDVMFGHAQATDVRAYYRDIHHDGVTFRQEVVTAIDPESRQVTTDKGTYDGDILVVALGADLDPSATPGLVEGGNEFYSFDGAVVMRDVLPTFTSGTAIIGVCGQFFKCPPAPCECAFMLHDYLAERGVRDAVHIKVVSPMGTPIPVSESTSVAILAGFAEKGIEYVGGGMVTELDPAARVVHTSSGGSHPYDLFLGVPKHVAPPVVVASGLTEDGWIPVDRGSFTTKFPNVYAVGDVTSAPVPRAGAIAEREAMAVARDITARLRGGRSGEPFDGTGLCYIEFGGGLVGRVDVSFYGPDGPTGPFSAPSRALSEEKEQFAPSRLARWFGASPAR
jgi:sulfide:quinone oxidoreductase